MASAPGGTRAPGGSRTMMALGEGLEARIPRHGLFGRLGTKAEAGALIAFLAGDWS